MEADRVTASLPCLPACSTAQQLLLTVSLLPVILSPLSCSFAGHPLCHSLRILQSLSGCGTQSPRPWTDISTTMPTGTSNSSSARESVTVCPTTLPTSCPRIAHASPTPSHRLMPAAGTCVSPRRQNAPRWTPISPQRNRTRDPSCRAYQRLRVAHIAGTQGSSPSQRGEMGRRGGGARAPRRPQLLLSHSRPLLTQGDGIPEWQGVAGWHNLTADPVRGPLSPPCVQSFLLLSPLPERPQHASTSRATRPRTAWTVLCCRRSPPAHALSCPNQRRADTQ